MLVQRITPVISRGRSGDEPKLRFIDGIADTQLFSRFYTTERTERYGVCLCVPYEVDVGRSGVIE